VAAEARRYPHRRVERGAVEARGKHLLMRFAATPRLTGPCRLLSGLGPDVMAPDFDVAQAVRRLRRV
jgi:hypothetical protein